MSFYSSIAQPGAFPYTPQRTFNPIDYGGNTTAAIRTAISAAKAAGGGTVVLDNVRYAHDGTPIRMLPGVRLKGTHVPFHWAQTGSKLGGHATQPTLQLTDPAETVVLTSVAVEGIYFDGGSDCITSVGSHDVALRDLTFYNPTGSGIRLAGQQENWFCDNLFFNFGAYGLRHEELGVGDAGGMPTMQKTAWRNIQFSGCGTGILSDSGEASNNNYWNQCRFDFLSTAAIVLKGTQTQWLFVNTSFEACCGTAAGHVTTGSITSGTTALTVAAAAGFVVGSALTVQGAAANGLDLSTTISAIVGSTLTLAAAAGTTVSGAEVTDFSALETALLPTTIPLGAGAAPTLITFVNCSMGNSNCLYALSAANSTVRLVNCVTGARPIYDPSYTLTSTGQDQAALIRRPSGYSAPSASYVRDVPAALGSARAQVVAPPGGDLILGLTGGSADHRTYDTAAAAGHLQVRGGASGRPTWLDVDGASGRTLQSAPNSAPSDSTLATSQISFYLDESGNTLRVRVKYSDGTLRSGTLALT